jgi:hypothetical protein
VSSSWPKKEEMDRARVWMGLPPTKEPYDAEEACRNFLSQAAVVEMAVRKLAREEKG